MAASHAISNVFSNDIHAASPWIWNGVVHLELNKDASGTFQGTVQSVLTHNAGPHWHFQGMVTLHQTAFRSIFLYQPDGPCIRTRIAKQFSSLVNGAIMK